MPVILEKDNEREWLSDLQINRVLELLRPYNGRDMRAYEVSRAVNSPENNDPSVLEPM
jgi:putative SOS response-associated peptidase YedK